MEKNPSGRQTLSSIELVSTLLMSAKDLCGLSMYETFDRFVSLSEAALSNISGEDWIRLASGIELALPKMQQALGELIYQALFTYEDILGSCYMRIGRGDSRFSQFFTPWKVACVMAEVLSVDFRSATLDKPLYVLDSACGSGVILLAIANTVPSEVLRSKRVYFAGIDIDPLCVKMTRLNLLLHSLIDCTVFIKQHSQLTIEEKEKVMEAVII